MRYERRDPRPEDLRQITELKSIVEAQDRDLRILTERFREIQMYQQHQQMQQALPPYAQVVAQQQGAGGIAPPRKSKSRTPQSKTNGHVLLPPPPAPTMLIGLDGLPVRQHMMPVCDVIYEENEEAEQNGEHKALVNEIINDMVATVNAQANGLSESAF